MKNRIAKKLIPIVITIMIVGTLLPLSVSPALAAEEATLATVDFETEGSGYSVTGGIAPTSSACWSRTDGSVISPDVAFSGKQGTYFFYGENTDYPLNDKAPVYVTLNSINVSGKTDLKLKISVAGNNSGTSAYEGDEYLRIEYAYDGGEFIRRAEFKAANTNDAYMTEDSNGDGITDGAILSPEFAEFTYSIPSDGTNLQIRIAANIDQGSEEIGFDNIRILGTEDTTAPTLSAASITNISSSGATLNFTSNEAGTYYYLVYAAADPAPNAATVKAQGTAAAKGSGAAAASANTAGVTGLSASTAYKAYVIVEDAAGNASAVSAIEITTSASAVGELAGSITQSSYSNVNLTSVGDADWAVWGYASSGTSTSLSPDESMSGGSGISDLTDIDPGTDDALRGLGQYHINHTFNWSNGTSTPSATGAYAGLQHNVAATYQTGDGFSFTVPADTTKRRLIVYTAVHYAVGELTATLSDGSAAALTLVHDAKDGVNSPSRFVIDYAAASDGQTLTITFVSTWNSKDGCGNVQIYAVALSDYHTATVNINKDGAAVDASGSVELWQGGSVVATAASSATGVYTALVLNGTYDIYIDGTDTGKDITISAADNSTTVNYYTVSFAVSNAGEASGSTISATAGGSSITSGDAVLSGKQVIITATGSGAAAYTYAWTGDGTGGETTQALTISSLSSAVNATCTVTGSSDITAPTLSSTSASGVTYSGATLNFTSDEAGTYYYIVYAAAAVAPDAATVKAQGAAIAKGTGAAAEAANTAGVTGLSGSTAYKAYVIVEDAAGNASAVSAIEITTSATPTVAASPASSLAESNLDTNSLAVTLTNVMFADGTLSSANFTLNNAPAGLTVQSVSYTDATHCTVYLAYDGTDFDTSVASFSLTVKGAELTLGSDLTSGTMSIIATLEITPTVATTAVTTYGTTWATMGGEVTASGGETVTERGVVYSYTDATPTIGESGVTKNDNGSGTGMFSETVGSLYQGTTYYVRAYATNSEGTSYGSVVSFTTLMASMSAAPASSLTEENLDTNSLNITLTNVTFADSTLSASNFVLNGSFAGLSVESVEYTDATHCKVNLAYDGTDFDANKAFSLSIMAAELAFGGDLTSGILSVSPTVETAPTVMTSAVTTYGTISATMGGNVTASGGEAVTERGVVYSSTDATPTIGEAGVTQDDNGTGTGSFSESIGSLAPGTTYYVRAYATNSEGTSYGSVVSFTTATPAVAASPASALTESNLDTNSLAVTLTNETFADDTLSDANFTLNNAPAGLTVQSVSYTDATHCTVNLAFDGTDFDTSVTDFSLTVAGAELTLSSGLTTGTMTITAMVETAPTASTTAVTTYGATTATMGGNVTSSGGEAVTERGVVYSGTDATPMIGEAGVTRDSNGTGTGSFSESIGSLAPGTTYYVRAYATNSEGTSYGAVVSFTTLTASVAANPVSALTEENLNTNSLNITLSNVTFADSTLSASNFVLNNAPAGLTVESVEYTDTTHCKVNLAFDGTDFDTDVTDFSLTVKAAELTAGEDLTTGTLTITATVEPLALVSSVESGRIYAGGRIVLTPNIEGGTWDWDEEYLSATFNSPATFTGLKVGTTRVTYTAGVESVYYDITIEANGLPGTGQNFTWVWVLIGAAAVLIAAAVLLMLRRKASGKANSEQ